MTNIKKQIEERAKETVEDLSGSKYSLETHIQAALLEIAEFCYRDAAEQCFEYSEDIQDNAFLSNKDRETSRDTASDIEQAILSRLAEIKGEE